MLLISCPNCGARDESEFSYGGRAIRYPGLENQSRRSWHEALHLQNNSSELIDELWYHESGCECWITISRNTATHEIVSRSLAEGGD